MIRRFITDTRLSVYLFLTAMLLIYAVQPLAVYYLIEPNPYFFDLAIVTLVGCGVLYLGYLMPLFDFQFRRRAPHVEIEAEIFHAIVWGSFLIFVIVTFVTADHIPIISALRGASIQDLDQQRGAFFKSRSGLGMILLYLSTFFVSALLPYSLIGLFSKRSWMRFPCLIIFLLLCVSFLAKSLFLAVAFPMLYFIARQKTFTLARFVIIAVASLTLLYILTLLAYNGGSTFEDSPAASQSFAEFFGPNYKASSAIDFLVWRSVAVPMFTASDALLVFAEQFNSDPLLGATSSFISGIFGLERVPFEKIVFEYQYGGWNEIANANSAFLVDSYVNFGWAGVIIFSLFVGQSMRWFRKSRDDGIRGLWMIWCFGLFNGGLIGMLLSNGYAAIFWMALFVRLTVRSRPVVASNPALQPS